MNRRGVLAGVAGLLAGGITLDTMSSSNRTRPIDSISQGDQTTREYTLARPVDGNPYQWEAIDLTDATRVGLSLTHVSGGGSMVSDVACSIEDPEDGVVSFTYSQSDTWNPAGDYHAQFHIDWSDGSEESLPPDGYEWWVELGPKQGGVPIDTPRIRADEGVIDDLRTTHHETDTLKVNEWLSGVIEDTTASQRITRLDGAGLEVSATGSLDMMDPLEDGYVEGNPHFHAGNSTGGDQLHPRDLRVAGHPVYDVTHPDYGAAGDGTADDTAAIKNAVNDAGSGTVFFPPGDYLVTDWIQADTDGLTIRGCGPATRIIVDGPDFWLRFEGSSTDPVEDVTVRGLHVDEISGNGIIRYRDATRPTLRNVSKTGLESGGGLAHFIGCTQGVVAHSSVRDISSTSALAFLRNSEDFLFADLFADGCGEIIDGNPMRGCIGVNIRGKNLSDELIDFGGSSYNAFFGLRGEAVNRGIILKTEIGDYGGTNHNLIDGLHLEDVGVAAIEGNGDGADATQTINNNTIRDVHAVGDGSGAHGVSWSHGSGLDVAENNTLENFYFNVQGDGIDMMSQQGLTIRDGHILGVDRGIRLVNHHDTHGFSRDVLIDDVKIDTTDRFGIYAEYLAEWDIRNCRLLDIGDPNDATAYRGIRVINSRRGRVSDTVIDRVTGRAVVLEIPNEYSRRDQINVALRNLDVTNTNLVGTTPAAVDLLNTDGTTVHGVELEGVTITDDQPLAEVTTGGLRWSQEFEAFALRNCTVRRTANSPDDELSLPGTNNVAAGNMFL